MKTSTLYPSSSWISRLTRATAILITLTVSPLAHATTYFVSNSGNDSNNGTSPMTPWQTLAKVGAETFRPGDAIVLKSGESFVGPLTMSSSGEPNNPIRIGSYGNGKATITATYTNGTGDGIDSTSTSYVTVEDLTISGTFGAYGVNFAATSGPHASIHIRNVTTSGFVYGIYIQAYSGGTYSDVRIRNSVAFNNPGGGIVVAGYNNNSAPGPSGNIADVIISGTNTYNNGTVSSSGHHSGWGVFYQGVYSGRVEHSASYGNGNLGFWTFDCNGIVFEHNTAYANQGPDGGFDFDLGTTNSIAQYNYTYNNSGEGYELTATSGSEDSNITLRYNISESDHTPIAIIDEASSAPSSYNDIKIYNNTLYTNRTDGLSFWATFNVFANSPPVNLVIANNIAENANSSVYDLQSLAPPLTLNYDDYVGAFEAFYNGTTYTNFNTFQTSTGLEMNGLFNVDPDFVGTPGSEDANVYKLASSSPLLNSGVDLKTMFGIDPGREDYYGNKLRRNVFSIGAYEGGSNDNRQ